MIRLGYLDDFGIAATGSTVQEALEAFMALYKIAGVEVKTLKSGRGVGIEFLG